MSDYIKLLQANAARNKRIVKLEAKGMTHDRIVEFLRCENIKLTRQAVQQICAAGRKK